MIRFEVLVQPSRHVPVAVVERVERAVLEPELQPELLRQLVPAELPLQRCFNAKTTRRQRVVLALQPERLVLGEDLHICISAVLACT